MKKKIFFLLAFFFIILLAGIFFEFKNVQAPTDSNRESVIGNQENTNNNIKNSQIDQIIDPLDGALSRITKKPFGIFITPKTSPVEPERFQGYHTGVDLETTTDEQNVDVSVVALCEGKMLSKRTASGYGGVIVQACVLDSQAVTVVYGHLRISSATAKVGDQLKAGDFLGNLGKGFSNETDGERKHLHLAIHKGFGINILGYVQQKIQLSAWLDPAKYLQ
ncbi:MAG: M23 family metallopeptidase [Candidatus Moranbacteria bacterium]|nr:M23 family metallopeptidase [Candidatus Moranbacteria bacterium]